MEGPADLEPTCPRCRRRHLPTLPCWNGDYSRKITALVLDLYGRSCHLCGTPGATTADHLTPRSRGGTDALDNLRPAHRFCNTSKGNAGASPVTPRVTVENSDRW